MEDDGSGPHARTLAMFGICLGVVIVGMIAVAAIIGG
jgi:hypothetical protein